MDKDPRQIRRMFAAIAGRYDLLNRVLSLSIDRGWRRRTVRALAPRSGERALDLCSGTGDLAMALTAAGADVTAADFTHAMLVRAARKAPGLRQVEADALALPFPDCSFHMVSIAFGLRNLADPTSGLREMLRVLRPGGRLAVLEFSTPTSRPLRSFYHLYLEKVLPAVGDALSGRAAPYRYLADSVRAFPDQQQVATVIQECGFGPARWIDLTGGIAALHLAERPRPDL